MTTRESPSREDDAALTIEEWQAISREVLELKCNYFNIPITGPTSELAKLLYAEYHRVSEHDDKEIDQTEEDSPRKKGRRRVPPISDESVG